MKKKICSFADLVERLREQDCFGAAGVTISDAERETLWEELMEISEKGVVTE